ncbi:MAG: c-type cytochrome, partial [Acidobacteriota bacterium]|nr:c-type cytochrome [Acidobacteriota bacterium]
MKAATSRTILILIAAAVALPSLALAADSDTPTFYADVLPVLQENCQTCHRPEGEGENIGGMIAPMPLMTYQQTRPWARSIARAVENRSMPPWFANEATRGHFHNERVMSDDEIETVLAWVRGGSPAGDA